jgi:hypothetical protein
MNPRDPLPLVAYAHTVQLIYPRHLRARYHDQMLQTARDADRDRTYSALQFWAYLYTDLFRSSLQEHTRMFRNELVARPIFFHTLAVAAILTICGAGAALTCQQMLRRGADQPQIQMAQSYASALQAGGSLEKTLPPVHVDIQNSLEPFAIFYNSDGQPVGSTGQLNQSVPTPPSGVFRYTRTHSFDKITWQPGAGVRIAAVVQRVDGPHPGFILTGRSLRLVEEQESILWRMAFSVWIGLLAVLAFGAVLLSHAQNARSRPMASQA